MNNYSVLKRQYVRTGHLSNSDSKFKIIIIKCSRAANSLDQELGFMYVGHDSFSTGTLEQDRLGLGG